ncbi:MAG TPA: Hsp33 family molecular chaperone HslO [Telmatospirillum sp.]|nr:Hsp33 family molecular chaperone HslO [Telmatospirillum sp.]
MSAVIAETRDHSQPFLIDAGAFRGRVVRLGPAIDGVLAGHDYPQAVASLLAETLALTATLAGALKFEGIFTLQIQADGAIPLIVADVTSTGDLRGYARFDAPKLEKALARRGPTVPRLLGKGHLAFTIDQGPDTDRYQGIVALSGDSLASCAHRYFEQSEQLETAFKLAVCPPQDDAGWRAAAMMIQRMPVGPQSPIFTAEEAAESWNRAVILMDSARENELLGPDISVETLLYRLYHAEGLQLHESRTLAARCRCSAERVTGTLKSFPRTEVESMRDDKGDVVVVCEFCKSRYVFADEDLDRLYQS